MRKTVAIAIAIQQTQETLDPAAIAVDRAKVIGSGLLVRYGEMFDVVSVWLARRRQRMALSTLDSRMLRDIGVTRDQAMHEAAKPFWKA